jgi:hypothetical protein
MVPGSFVLHPGECNPFLSLSSRVLRGQSSKALIAAKGDGLAGKNFEQVLEWWNRFA